jgi:hypothetical protein
VAPAARQGGTTNAPSGGVRLARGLDVSSSGVSLVRDLDAPSGEFRLAQGLNAPRAGSASLEGSAPPGEVRLARGLNAPSARTVSLKGTCTHIVHAPAPVYGHLMPLTRSGIASRRCFTNSLGEAIPVAV